MLATSLILLSFFAISVDVAGPAYLRALVLMRPVTRLPMKSKGSGNICEAQGMNKESVYWTFLSPLYLADDGHV